MRGLCLSLLMATIFVGCGPEQTTRDSENKQIHDEVEKQRLLYASLVGNYKGTARVRSGNVNIEIYLRAASSYQPDPRSGQKREVPELIGNLAICDAKAGCETYYNYDDNYYDGENKKLILKQRVMGTQAPSSYLTLNFKDEVLTGSGYMGNIPYALIRVQRFSK
jgi:hypothetical protein